MMIALVRFGQTHAITTMGDVFKGKQAIEIACTGTIELSAENKSRYKVFDGLGDNVACPQCRRLTGLDREEEENAD